MIAAHQLSKHFGGQRVIRAVDSLTFEVPRGSVTGFLGPNGAGKTTTIRMIAGYLPPSQGRVLVDGLDVSEHWREVRRRIGYLPEAAPSYAEMRVHEYLTLRAKLFSIPRTHRQAAIDRAVERCWLRDVRARPIHQLSKGYRQRVGLAAAMLHEPPVLILDEPTVGLDPAQIREVRGLIDELKGDHTVLLSTHILPEVELTCDRIMILARGRIVAQGTTDELWEAAGEGGYIVEAASENVAAVVRAVPGIADVSASPLAEGNFTRLHVTAIPNVGDRREAIAARLHEAGIVVRELRREQPSLEGLYLQLIEGREMQSRQSSQGVAA
ncbi:MAG TPA: ABC transporter ATP-binding protein [Phycisphaerales bacterium]|nr:ABC transporter ATP-binding protein [Phycisphaerales bacterium]